MSIDIRVDGRRRRRRTRKGDDEGWKEEEDEGEMRYHEGHEREWRYPILESDHLVFSALFLDFSPRDVPLSLSFRG